MKDAWANPYGSPLLRQCFDGRDPNADFSEAALPPLFRKVSDILSATSCETVRREPSVFRAFSRFFFIFFFFFFVFFFTFL
jgi:hypothetical protein